MIVRQYIKDFEDMGLGMFVHFGLYSVIGRGEWAQNQVPIPMEEYVKTVSDFKIKENWAEELVCTAKNAGCRYITLTTRHHDGFSLYDTCGLNDYDAPHSATGRDLVREFVDECRRQDVVPFFYHTLLDWWKPEFKSDFKAYLRYLRASVELLCKNYGKIGGFWFDGKWSKEDGDWEEDELYGMIRSYQPDAMIINNSGTERLGATGHIELDSVTFERGRTTRRKDADCPKYLASEMCQIFGEYWGYAEKCLRYKPFSEILTNLMDCRRAHANFLLNVGPMADGRLSLRDRGYFEMLGVWMKINGSAVYDSEPCDYPTGSEEDFLLYNHKNHRYYLVMMGKSYREVTFTMDKPVKSVRCLDEDYPTPFVQEGDQVRFTAGHYAFGTDLVVRVVEIRV